jgi:hypothetical protein
MALRGRPVAEHEEVGAVVNDSTGEEFMSKSPLAEIAKDMAGIDIAILSTHTESGEIANRPMSNNGDVAYDGTSYYFSATNRRGPSPAKSESRALEGQRSRRSRALTLAETKTGIRIGEIDASLRCSRELDDRGMAW